MRSTQITLGVSFREPDYSRSLCAYAALFAVVKLTMSASTVQGQTIIEVILELLALIGSFFLLLFLYAHSGSALRHLRFIFTSHRNRTQSKQTTVKDVETGNVCHQGQASPSEVSEISEVHDHSTDIHPTPMERVLVYLHTLPTDSNKFLCMREVSTRTSEEDAEAEDRGGSRSVVDDNEGTCEATEESLESNWVEIIRDFPQPPDAKVFELDLDGAASSTSGPGLRDIVDSDVDDKKDED